MTQVYYKKTSSITVVQTCLAVYNIPSSIFASVSNALIILTLLRTKTLRTPTNIFTGSMCFTDFLVGAVVQPLFITLNLSGTSNSHHCFLRSALSFSSVLCCGLSMLTLALISLDTYFAICQPYRYQACNLQPLYQAIIVCVWICWTTFSVLPFVNVVTPDTFYMVVTILPVLTFVLITYCYLKIFCVVRSKIRNVVPLGRLSIAHNICSARQRRKSKTIAFMILVFAACYIPIAIFTGISSIWTLNWSILHIVSPVLETGVYLNSLFNPMIYCFRMTGIRVSVCKLLRFPPKAL